MRIAYRLRRSLRARLIVGTAAMLMPLIVLAAGTFMIFQALLGSFIEVTDETIEQVQPNNNLQERMLELRGALDHYLISGAGSARLSFERQSARVDADFNSFTRAPFSRAGEKEAVLEAWRQWKVAKSESQAVLKARGPGADRVIRKRMEIIDLRLDRAGAQLRRANEFDLREIRQELRAARAGRIRNVALIGAAFLFGAAVALAAGSMLARSIIRPIDILSEGVRNLGHGGLGYRVTMPAPDELGKLGDAFNTMAQRLEINQAALEDLATHDSLTGLYNMREFYRRLDEEISRSSRYGFSMGLLMIDIDRFKSVNDSFGHRAGDDVLVKVSELIAGHIRPIDKVARYGGEEFVVILPQTDGDGAPAAAERIRQAVAAEDFPVGRERTIKLTISAGVAVYADDGRSDEELIYQADQALYAAKRAGRNCVRRWSESMGKAA